MLKPFIDFQIESEKVWLLWETCPDLDTLSNILTNTQLTDQG